MPTEIFSVFGSYDFFGKSLPGMSLVLGVTPLLPKGVIPIPDLAGNFLVFIIVLISIALIGTLLGEAVHAIAINFEHTVAWLGRRVYHTVQLLLDSTDIDLEPSRSPINRYTGREEESPDDSDNPDDPDGDDTLEKGLIESWKHKIRAWFHNRFDDIVMVLLSHRKIFKGYLIGPLDFPDPTTDRPMPGAESFIQEHLIKKAGNEFDIKTKNDADAVYSVITSTLSKKGHRRAFRLQARYAFCRGMWMTLFASAALYGLFLKFPRPLVPKALMYKSYLTILKPNQIGMVAIILFIISLIFASASGGYKRRYINYLMAELYALDEVLVEE